MRELLLLGIKPLGKQVRKAIKTGGDEKIIAFRYKGAGGADEKSNKNRRE